MRGKLVWLLFLVVATPLMSADILVMPTKIDLGNIRWGRSKSFTIKVINNSKQPYSITKIVTYCSFLYVDRGVVGRQIKPGAEVEIKGAYRARVIGYFGKVIEIYTNDPSFPKITVEITGKVYYPNKLPKLEITPKKVKLGFLYPGEKREFTVKVSNKGNNTLKITYSGLNLPPTGDSSNSLQIPPGKTVEIGFEFKGGREGKFHELLWFASNDPFRPKIPIIVEGKVVPYARDVANGVSLKKLTPLFLFFTGLVVIVFAVIKYA